MNESTQQTENQATASGYASESKHFCCPFAALDPDFWKKIQKKPFRKRHPIIFWFAALLIAGWFFSQIISFFAIDGEDIGEPRLALVKIEGVIMDSLPTAQWIDKILSRGDAKGILVLVNSPGGGAAASQEIYFALKRAAAKIPVCVSMGSTAASGGLMVSLAGERIFAAPSTITGSIGVRMDIPQFQDLMSKIGIGQETLVTGPFKDAASYTHALTPEDRRYLLGVLENMHSQFVDLVSENRKITRDKAAALADGKIYTGQQALELGLIDELGSLHEAKVWLARKAGVPENGNLIEKPVKKRQLLNLLLQKATTFIQDFFRESWVETTTPVFQYR